MILTAPEPPNITFLTTQTPTHTPPPYWWRVLVVACGRGLVECSWSRVVACAGGDGLCFCYFVPMEMAHHWHDVNCW